MKNTLLLEGMGWTVIRFWETDLSGGLQQAVREISAALVQLSSAT